MSTPVVNPHQVFDMAEAFWRCSDVTGQVASMPPENPWLHMVSAANSVFALELYFKCLLHLETGKAPTTHSLLKLYNSVSVTNRQAIVATFDAAMASDLAFARLPPQFGGLQNDIVSILTLNDDSFEKFRYGYEGKFAHGQGTLGLPAVIRGVRERILALKPEFAVRSRLGGP